ncbi:glycosyltransferase family 4 protein, partial [Serratia marcescens]|uniref:glycosyltransferase family 4 protein n=1 Tax=Serratia marcescens TaxID=615 RepID=UPI0013DC4602
DTTIFRPPPDGSAGADTILSIGRLTAAKGVLEVVDVVARLRERGLDVRLRLLGEALTVADRAYVEQIRDAIGRDGLAEHAELLG